MIINNVDDEIDKLKVKKIELTNRMNTIIGFDDKELLKQEIGRIDNQISILEKYKKK